MTGLHSKKVRHKSDGRHRSCEVCYDNESVGEVWGELYGAMGWDDATRVINHLHAFMVEIRDTPFLKKHGTLDFPDALAS